jgi:HSP20 family molecular chaperone IbpA
MVTTTTFGMDFFRDPFFIGFNREVERFNSLHQLNRGSFPPYDLLKLDDITVSVEDSSLTITGEIVEVTDAEVLHKGIAGRKFTRSFELGEYMEVSEVTLKDGMLTIDIDRNIPKEKLPKIIKIK